MRELRRQSSAGSTGPKVSKPRRDLPVKQETWILVILMVLALPILGWPLRHSLNSQTLQTFLIVGAFAATGAALVIGAIVAWGRLAAWFKRPRG